MRKDKNKLLDKKTKRASLRNRVKGGRHAPSRQGQRFDLEDSGSREKRVRAEGDTVHKGRDGPLKRFLRSRVGQAWGNVYAELCASVRNDNVARTVLDQSIRGGLVQLNVQLIDGVPLIKGEFYVCPKSAQLKRHSGKRKGSGR